MDSWKWRWLIHSMCRMVIATDKRMMRENVLGHRLGRTDDLARDRKALGELLLEAAEELDVLGLLAGEFQIGAGAIVLAVDVGARVIEHEGQDEFLDQAEDRKIGVAANVIERALLERRQEVQRRDAREVLGHERLGEIERLAVADQILDPPGDALGTGENVLEIVVMTHLVFLSLNRFRR